MSLKLSKLYISNFRNLESQAITFSSGINCFIGPNGNGKTNLLEAIFYLSYRRSFKKNTSFPQLLSMDGENQEISFSSVLLDVNKSREIPYSGKLAGQASSQWYLEGKPVKVKPNLKSIIINPYDAIQFHMKPAFRREWMDFYFSQLDKDYRSNLRQFNLCMRQRNRLLSERPRELDRQLDVFDQQLSVFGFKLVAIRRRILLELEAFIEQIYKKLFFEEHQLTFQIESFFTGDSERQLLEAYQKNRVIDVASGRTKQGIHLDDYVPYFDGLNSLEFCSLGQQKIAYLSLIFAYIELFRYKFNTYPLVLIDDVSGELDKERWSRLIRYLERKDFQVFITTANEAFGTELEKILGAEKFNVSAGKIQANQ